MPNKPAAVLDTNIFIRTLLKSPVCLELWKALGEGRFSLLISAAIWEELTLTLRKYGPEIGLSKEEITDLLAFVEGEAAVVAPGVSVWDCRDPKDNKFLECALGAKASAIVSMDKDLLVLNPWRNIPIVKPDEFLDLIRK